MASESPAKTIKTLGGFELIQKIGQGGMGTVLKARQISLDRVVALKVLPPKIAQKDPVFVDRFIREARTSAKLNHPNIVQGIEVGKDEATGLYFFAMEFIDGPTVKALLKQQRVLEEKRALEIALGVTQALICAHRAGIVHRDIKPDNILLTSRGEPKLADLGLARHALDNEEGEDDGKASADDPFGLQSARKSDLTQAGSAVGTPSYMAPEQIRAEMDKIDARTDLYALGTTLFHMLTGKPPYAGGNSKHVMAMHLTSPVPDARASNPAISESTSKMVFKLMQKEQEKRVQSPEELAKEIERILHGKPVPAIKSGKHAPVPDGERATHSAESTAWRTHVTGTAPIKTSGRQGRTPGKSRTMLYAGIGVTVVAVAGIAYAFSAGHKLPPPVVQVHKDSDVKVPPVPSVPVAPTPPVADTHKTTESPASSSGSSSSSSSSSGSGGVLTEAPSPEASKWPALDHAMKYFKEHPTDFAACLEKFHDAEKGAPVDMIPTIRHERNKVEHARDAAFLAILDDRVKSARAAVADGNTNFGAALGFLQESSFNVALTDGNKTTLANVRDDFEKQSLEAFKKNVEPGLNKEFEAAGASATNLEALQQKLPGISKMYAVKPVVDAIEALNKNVAKRLQEAKDKIFATQDDIFRRTVGTAYALSVSGDFTDAYNKLNALQSDSAMASRHGASIGVLALDIQFHHNTLKAACDALNAKADKTEDVVLHDLDGTTVSGKVMQRVDKLGGRYLIQSDKPQMIESLKLEAADALQLANQNPQGSERTYKEGTYYFWRGKTAKAYELFAKLKKDNAPEASTAATYMTWMDFKATEMMNNMFDLFAQAHSGKLPPDESKQKQQDAFKLLQRLKSDYSTTEAYRAKHPKK